MMDANEKGPVGGQGLAISFGEDNLQEKNSNQQPIEQAVIPFPVRNRLPTISDMVRLYKATHVPAGPYQTPLPDDLIRG